MVAGLPNDEQTRGDRAPSVAVLIADPHSASRSALRIALEDAETVRVVGEAAGLRGAIKAVAGSQVDVVLADSRVAGIGSESARAGLVQLSRRVPVFVMGMGDPRVYTPALQAAGAAGYWPKDGDPAHLAHLLSTSAHGRPRTATARSHKARARTQLTNTRKQGLGRAAH